MLTAALCALLHLQGVDCPFTGAGLWDGRRYGTHTAATCSYVPKFRCVLADPAMLQGEAAGPGCPVT
jgi:hypothetical protein